MLSNFRAITLSYKSAPIEIRESVALTESNIRTLLVKIKDIIDASEVLILSTCNRTEVYYSANTDFSNQIVSLICFEKGIMQVDGYLPYFEPINNHENAVSHLYEVSLGLQSQVVGDLQIINQVKHAYQWSADANMAGPFLHRLLHTIFFTNKKVVQETSFRDGAASVSYAAVELVENLTSEIANPKVLIMGLGEIGADVCRNFSGSRITDISVSNRTPKRSESIAEECGFAIVPFEEVWHAIAEADVIISAIVRDEAFFTKDKVAQLHLLKHKFFIDLSIPRSVASDVEDLPGALVYNIDNIKSKANEALEKRILAIPKVREIMQESLLEFNDWSKEMVVSPTIQKLKNALEQIRLDELSRYAKQLDDAEAQKIDMITKNIMQKIIKLPVLQLKAACKRGEAETLIDVLNDLFNLDQKAESK